MGYALSLSELASNLGTATADGMVNIANTAANFACEAYSQYANATTNFPDPTGIGAFNNALYSRLCSPRGKNPPGGNDSWSGGQCSVLYTVTVENTDGSGTKTTVQYFNIPGPIYGIQKRTVGSSYKYYIIVPNYSGPPSGLYEVGSVGTTDPQAQKYNRRITGVARKDGQPDNCGNYPYPYPNISFPDTSLLVKNNVTINVGGGAQITGNLTLIPVITNAQAFIYPQIKVGVGPFNVSFDLGGVTITPNFNFSSDNQSPPVDSLPPSSPTPQGREKQNDPCSTTIPPTDLTPVITKLNNLQTTSNEIKDCACPITYQPSTSSLGAGISGYAVLPSNCIKINLTLTQKPSNAKIQKSNGSEPDLYFCGYFYWGDGTGRSERIPLNTTQNVLFPPAWATAFGWNLYTGYNCSVTATSLSPSKTGGKLTPLLMYNGPV